jgi:transposase-like protein
VRGGCRRPARPVRSRACGRSDATLPWRGEICSKNVSELLPLLYLRGLSTGDFREALPVLLGEEAAGLSPSSITRLVSMWQDEYEAWKKRSIADRDYVYVWVDGVHFGVRLEDERLCALVMIGARPDGPKEIIALEDGYRESKESWEELLRDVSKRGMRVPEVAIGDGALGFWAAVRDVWPATREQRTRRDARRLPRHSRRVARDSRAVDLSRRAIALREEIVSRVSRRSRRASRLVRTDAGRSARRSRRLPLDSRTARRSRNPIASRERIARSASRRRRTDAAGARRAPIRASRDARWLDFDLRIVPTDARVARPASRRARSAPKS